MDTLPSAHCAVMQISTQYYADTQHGESPSNSMLKLAHRHITAHADSIDAENRPAWPDKTCVKNTHSIFQHASYILIVMTDVSTLLSNVISITHVC